jgi:hypothetical protein
VLRGRAQILALTGRATGLWHSRATGPAGLVAQQQHRTESALPPDVAASDGAGSVWPPAEEGPRSSEPGLVLVLAAHWSWR